MALLSMHALLWRHFWTIGRLWALLGCCLGPGLYAFHALDALYAPRHVRGKTLMRIWQSNLQLLDRSRYQAGAQHP